MDIQTLQEMLASLREMQATLGDMQKLQAHRDTLDLVHRVLGSVWTVGAYFIGFWAGRRVERTQVEEAVRKAIHRALFVWSRRNK